MTIVKIFGKHLFRIPRCLDIKWKEFMPDYHCIMNRGI